MTQRLSQEARRRLEISLVHEPGSAAAARALAAGRVRRTAAADEALARAAGAGMRWVIPGEPEWPAGVDDLDHPDPVSGSGGAPAGLWIRGAARLDDLVADAVGIVGARDCTTYGAELAGDIAADCADHGLTVVSGAAFGIDACAHRGALMMERPTIAVLACGADVDYPRAHAALLSRILADGLVVSEHAPGVPVARHRFLARNRLIAALTRGVVVVEAARRSGSLNTLHWADQLGRTTMAVPGPVTSQQSAGTHQAVRDGKAILVTSGLDVVAAMRGLDTAEPEPDLFTAS